MKWSSSSNSSLSSAGAMNGSNCTTSSTVSQNGNASGVGGVFRSLSSNNSNSNGDRRSIFYTDAIDMDILKNYNTANSSKSSSSSGSKSSNSLPPSPPTLTTVRVRHRQSSNPTETMQVNQRKCDNLVSFFSSQIQSLTEELESERRWRDTHLTKIVKALLGFEAKLRNDQKTIRSQLYERDAEVNRLARELIALREKYGVKDDQVIEINEVAQFCPNCRKQYYQYDSKDAAVQVAKHELNDPTNENGMRRESSSEEGLGQVFSEARRSKRYMSKRTSGTFREYLKSRNIDLSIRNDCDEAEKEPSTGDRSNEEVKKVTAPALKSSSSLTRRGSMRRSVKMTLNCDKNGNNCVTKQTNDVSDSSSTANEKCDSQTKCGEKEAAEADAFLMKYDDEVGTPKTQFESTDDWYASASDMDDSDSAVSKPYGYNAVNPVLECVNQILLQQSMDGIMDMNANENSSPVTTASTVANAVNGLQTGNGSTETSPKDTNTLKKRVHFSTQNSMVQVPRSESIGNSSMTNDSSHDSKEHSIAMSYATIYSGNEYEPIGSENNSSNHYVDMESKLDDEHRPVIKTPPALPPKPANLMKLRQALKLPMNSFIKPHQAMKLTDNESEPDYCSISDIQESVVKQVQIVVDVHKTAEDDVSSHGSDDAKTDMTDETFADVPKLPNVTAIISPKKDANASKVITHDNYITKTASLANRGKIVPPIVTSVSSILTEMNAKSTNGVITTKSNFDDKKSLMSTKTSSNPPRMKTIIESTKSTAVNSIKNGLPATMKPCEKMLMPIEAEFDWYNLDVEYNKIPVSRDKADLRKIDSQNNNFSVEYNLDAEFSLTSSSVSSDNNSSLESNGSTINYIPVKITGDTKCLTADVKMNTLPSKLQQLRSKKLTGKSGETNEKAFDSFLEHTGLTAKPLPQKRKIFYNAPFV